jgi:hypothetical protein
LLFMSKPVDNSDSTGTISQDDITDLTLDTLEVVQDGPPVKRFKLDATTWKSTVMDIQPETSDGYVFNVSNLAATNKFRINTDTDMTTVKTTMEIRKYDTEALVVGDGGIADVLIVDTATPSTTVKAPLTVQFSDAEAFSVGVDAFDKTMTVDTATKASAFNGAVTCQGNLLVDVTNTEAVLIRKNADAEDILTIDTSTPLVRSDAPTIIDVTNNSAFQVRAAVGNDPVITVDTTIATPVFTCNGQQVIDITNAEAFLIRQNNDTADIFTVNTSTPAVTIGSGYLRIPLGTFSAPSLQIGDTDTGFYANAAGAIDVAINGSRRMTWTTAGDFRLHSTNSGNLYCDVAGTFHIFNSTNNNIKLSVTGTTGYIELGAGAGRTGFAYLRPTDSKIYTDLFRVYETTGTTPYLTVSGTTGTTTLGGGLAFSSSSFATSDTITLEDSIPNKNLVIEFQKVGNIVHASWPTTTWTAAVAFLDTSTTGDKFPAAFRPAGEIQIPVSFKSASTFEYRNMLFSTDGDIIISRNDGTITASANVILYGNSVTWKV